MEVEDIRYLPFVGKLTLLSIVVARRRGIQRPSTGDIHRVYGELAGMIGEQPVTLRIVSAYLKLFSDYGIVKSSVKSYGRYGKSRFIQSLNISELEILDYLREDPVIGELMVSLGLEDDINIVMWRAERLKKLVLEQSDKLMEIEKKLGSIPQILQGIRLKVGLDFPKSVSGSSLSERARKRFGKRDSQLGVLRSYGWFLRELRPIAEVVYSISSDLLEIENIVKEALDLVGLPPHESQYKRIDMEERRVQNEISG